MSVSVDERLLQDFQDPEYRHTYAEALLNSMVATQIKVLREQREWTQARLAQEAGGMRQSTISEIEDPDYSNWSLRTLKRLAKAFDLRLRVSFEEFSTLPTDIERVTRESLERASFAEDPMFGYPRSRQTRPAVTEIAEYVRARGHSGQSTAIDGGQPEDVPATEEVVVRRKSPGTAEIPTDKHFAATL